MWSIRTDAHNEIRKCVRKMSHPAAEFTKITGIAKGAKSFQLNIFQMTDNISPMDSNSLTAGVMHNKNGNAIRIIEPKIKHQPHTVISASHDK